MIKKIAIILAVISIISVVALTGTKFLNVKNMEEQGGDASSYHEMSAVLYIVVGILMMTSGIITFYLTKHISAFIIPFGLGVTLLGYGFYICYLKGIVSF